MLFLMDYVYVVVHLMLALYLFFLRRPQIMYIFQFHPHQKTLTLKDGQSLMGFGYANIFIK